MVRLRGPDRRETERFFDFTLQPLPEEDGRLERVLIVLAAQFSTWRPAWLAAGLAFGLTSLPLRPVRLLSLPRSPSSAPRPG